MYTYIVIDDESLIRKGIIKKLSSIRDTVLCTGEASNGEEALSLIESIDPDIVITDMKMPLMDGTAFLTLLTQRFPHIKAIVISGYKDFDYMKHAIAAQAVDYLLKPFGKEALTEAVMNAVKQLNDHQSIQNRLVSSDEKKEQARYKYDIQMLQNMIMGYHTSDFSITSKRLNFINQIHHLVMITVYSQTALDFTMLEAFLSDNSFGDLALLLEHTTNQNLGFFILFKPEHSVLSSEEMCRQLIQQLNNTLYSSQITVLFGCSRTHHSLLELNTAFLETVTALNTKTVAGSSTAFFPLNRKREPIIITWDKTEEFLFRIEAGMIPQTEALLEELFNYFLTIPDCSLYDIKVFCFSLADQTRYMMSTYFDQINPSSANSSMQNILNNMFSLPEIKDYYQQFYQNIASLFKADNIYATDDIIEKMKIYMERHYQNNLTIEFLSSLFYLNRSYCSHLFKQRTGETFVHCLNTIRIARAKQMLSETDKKMYQIAKASGYDNVKYFFRIFKKYEHMTPEQFRLLYRP